MATETPDIEYVEVQYVGKYGRGHHRAYCSGVGELFFGEIARVTLEVYENLSKTEFRRVDGVCRVLKMNGDLCPNSVEKGQHQCSACQRQFKSRAKLKPRKRKSQ